mgnify:FL=1
MRSLTSIVAVLCAPLVSGGSLHVGSLVQFGSAQSHDTAIAGANVTLYLAGGQSGSDEQALGSSLSDSETGWPS